MNKQKETVTKCQMCGETTNFDDHYKKYFCTKCVYAGSEADVKEE